ncbi:CMRF35-like molecule 7 [Sciurus carolinensis]|uniref:CMRF35-like molecule 7 n=1 Tax=Sciurus carolinensis TaxID=30640 RepID=UPI001FB54FDF|nr:CMRF35-like molecule 7 [Sciurus carolinensis]
MWLPPALLLFSLPGCFSIFSIQGPKSVRGPEQGSVTVLCRYSPEWKAYHKWWCRGARWHTCRILVQTRGSEQEEKSGRVSIRDNRRDHSFEVTMEKLQQDDTDTYWCGIEKTGTDLGTQVKVTVCPVRTDDTSSKPLAWPTANSLGMSSGSSKRHHYLLLVFLKVPILLILAGVILWLKGSQRIPEEEWEESVYTNLNFKLPTKDVAP